MQVPLVLVLLFIHQIHHCLVLARVYLFHDRLLLVRLIFDIDTWRVRFQWPFRNRSVRSLARLRPHCHPDGLFNPSNSHCSFPAFETALFQVLWATVSRLILRGPLGGAITALWAKLVSVIHLVFELRFFGHLLLELF